MPADLAARYQSWLEEVAVLISPHERTAFLGLQKDYQRDAFIRRFWEVRDPFPQTPVNELRARWEPRAELARQRYGNLTDDRARMILFNGEPKEVLTGRCDVLLPVELWSYPGTETLRGQFTIAFVSKNGAPKGPFRLWSPLDGIETLLSLDLRGEDPGAGAGLRRHRRALPARRGHRRPARRGDRLETGRGKGPSHPPPQRGVDRDLRLLLDRRARGSGGLPGPARPRLPRPLRQPHRGAGGGLGAARRRAPGEARRRSRGLSTASWWTARC